MVNFTDPAWWTTISVLIASLVATFDTNLEAPVKAAITSVGGLVVSIYTISHHATIRATARNGTSLAVARMNNQTELVRSGAVVPTK